MIREHAPTAVYAQNDGRTGAVADPHAVSPRYRNILVPTFLEPADRSALVRAMELAAFHGASLFVLYIRPQDDSAGSYHWLDGIQRLYGALNNGGEDFAGDVAAASEAVRLQIKQFLERELPASLIDGVEIHTDWRCGEPGEVIVRFAEAAGAELIVLSSGPSRWWLPTLPAAVRRVLQLSKREVLIVRPDERPASAGSVC